METFFFDPLLFCRLNFSGCWKEELFKLVPGNTGLFNVWTLKRKQKISELHIFPQCGTSGPKGQRTCNRRRISGRALRTASWVKSSNQPRNQALFYHDLQGKTHRLRQVMEHVPGTHDYKREEMGSLGEDNLTCCPRIVSCFLMGVNRGPPVDGVSLASGSLGGHWGADLPSSVSCRAQEAVQRFGHSW